MFIRNAGRALCIVLLAMSLADAAQAQTQFGKIVAFGDSLSDGGAYTNFFKSLNLPGANQVTRFKFTTNPGNVWVENIANRFGIPLTPNALDGGLNYAEGNARVTLPNPSAQGLSQNPVSVQIDRFLSSGGSFGKNDIVTMLVGANDLFQGGPTAATPAAAALIAQLGRLQNAGAKNIILLNVPDIGSTPQFGFGAGPTSIVGTQLSTAFNSALRQGLQGFTGNVLYIDAFTIYRDVVANPTRFGITTLNTVACLTPSSGQCTPATTVPNAAETSLFADGVHPTTAGHRILADAVLATFLAPSQISLLPLSVQSSLRGQQLVYDDRLFPYDGHAIRTLELFGGVSYAPYKIDSSGQLNGVDTKNRSLTIGGDYQLSEAAGIGAVVSHTDAGTNFGNNTGSFDMALTSIGGYGRVNFRQFYGFGTGNFGWTDLDNVRRDVHINTAVRSESGSTSGNAATFRLGGGYDAPIGGWEVGPLLSLNYDHISVDGYTEDGSSATQLKFGSQTLSQWTGSVGMQAHLKETSSAVSPYVRAMFDYDLTHSSRTVSIQNQIAVAPFEGAAFLPGRSAFVLHGGARARLAKNVGMQVNATGIFAQSNVASYGVSAALSVGF